MVTAVCLIVLMFATDSAPAKPPAEVVAEWTDPGLTAGNLIDFAVGLRSHPNPRYSPPWAFALSAEAYERLRAFGRETSPVERTLGHAYFLAGDLPHAIVAYRRGLALDPADAKLRTALEHARDQVAYPPGSGLRPTPTLWPPWLSLRYVGVYAFALYCAGCLAATRWRMTRHRRWLVSAGVFFAVAAVPAIGSVIEWQRQRRDVAEPVVVVVRDVPLRAGNGADYPAKLNLPRGCEVRRLFERGGWLQVETAGGAVGWVPPAAVVD